MIEFPKTQFTQLQKDTSSAITKTFCLEIVRLLKGGNRVPSFYQIIFSGKLNTKFDIKIGKSCSCNGSLFAPNPEKISNQKKKLNCSEIRSNPILIS